jgi:hypothetical protein
MRADLSKGQKITQTNALLGFHDNDDFIKEKKEKFSKFEEIIF